CGRPFQHKATGQTWHVYFTAGKDTLKRWKAKPSPVPVVAEQIPEALKQKPHWVVWRYERRPGKNGASEWNKVPHDACTGQTADTTDPATWASFAEAVAAYDQGGWDGIGFVFAGDGVAGVDLDECLDPLTGSLAEEAQRIVGELDSYTDVSPSGTG